MLILLAVTGIARGRQVQAHGPDHAQVAQLSLQLEQHPGDLAARLRRGELLRDHARSGDTNSLARARADFAFVLERSPQHLPAQLGMARVEADAGELTNALRRLDQVLSRSNHVAMAHLQRAGLLVRCQRPREAVTAYDAALRLQNQPRPETFLHRARAQLAATPTDFPAAIAGLDAGLARLGPVPGLQLLALDLSIRAGWYSNALERIDGLAAESERQESWLARRGDVLAAAGRHGDARVAWEAARKACTELPERLRNSHALRELQSTLAEKLAAKVAEPMPQPQNPPSPR